MLVPLSGEDQLQAARHGDQDALAALFRAHQPPLLRYLRAQERDAGDDLAADTWLAVARRLGTFEGDERGFRAWLFTIARNRLADHRRAAVRRRTDATPDERFEELGGSVDPADAVLAEVGAQAAVDQIVDLLSGDQADVVLLRVVAGFDAAEVARLTGRTPGAVRVLQHRALRRLSTTYRPTVVTE
jgi:RNA polymerase sigma-70 factor, ECF subfamily